MVDKKKTFDKSLGGKGYSLRFGSWRAMMEQLFLIASTTKDRSSVVRIADN